MRAATRALTSLYFGLVVSSGVFMMSAQQPTPLSNGSTAVGPEAGYQWYQKKADEWRSEARLLRALQVLLVGIAIVSSILAASKMPLPTWLPAWVLPLTTALAVGVFTGLDINTQANKERDAWRHLSAGLSEYRDGDAKIDRVRQAYIEGEGIIGAYNPQSTKN